MSIEKGKPKTINCKLCGDSILSVAVHLRASTETGKCDCVKRPINKDGSAMTDQEAFEEYKRMYPSAQTMSTDALNYMKKVQAEKLKESVAKVEMATAETSDDIKVTLTHSHSGTTEYRTERVAANEILDLPLSRLCNSTGREIIVDTFINRPFPEYVPDINEAYVFNDTELVKDVLMMFTAGMPGYLWGHAGTGKAQPIDSIIPTPEGMKRFGDLQVGDKVFGSDGKPTTIVEVFPQGMKPVFKIGFRDKSFTRACGEHLWTTLSSHDYKQETIVRSTQEMIDAGLKHTTGYKFKIPLVKPVTWSDREHFIHPYVLGVMIGDGYAVGTIPIISIGVDDMDIKDMVEKLLPLGVRTDVLRKTSENGCQFTVIDETVFHGNRIKNEIARLGLNVHSGEKFIPSEYLFDSEKNRMALLCGLMDTDGTSRGNRIGFSTTSRKLAENVKFLVQSLGGTAILKEHKTSRHKSGYYAEINVKMLVCPFKSKRKSSNWMPNKKNPPSRFITSIVPDGSAECMCIKVKADDSLYVTENFIVTHNTSLVSQVAARLGRPLIRSQHTASTEEAHITGQILAKDGRTYFEAGLLSLAMKHGWIYLADEYDFAYPQILSLYQPVLEGEPLILKEATPDWRKVQRHKHFAFVATGNTNGSGDETGLYQGTNQQNAANYSRFAIVSKVNYLPIDQEKVILMAYGIPEQLANKLVQFAKRIREAYEAHEIAQPIGPRELLNAGLVGTMRSNPVLGLQKAYINKLPSASAIAANEFAQRIFGIA
ncbi:porphyrin biosynthesis protein [Xenorhabdus hominickii]|uniref:Aerobic cobaltochelatase subunit CobS n=1 Tax=Xenorhabdus hominickii TaxID=351679 RepID=A0A1V0M449_XENHO|nr:AAA family ATPase [Xenorhabdus hominickii]ARD69643.1 Aerobic cobaltochelatase subunit CobS [Xenorhabdus hominickii]PHM52357.1 porphyrin biosynthesis protein [Xenorhabdus hominickii]